MADLDTEITKEELQKEIADILNNASLDKTSTKKVIQKLEQKLGVDLTEKKKLIDQLVMDYVNSMDSEEEEFEVESEDEPPKKKPAVRKAKKRDDDEDEEEHDDSNDSDWGYHHHHGNHLDEHLLDGYDDETCHPLPQESTITTTGMQNLSRLPKKTLILQRVTPIQEDEADIFGKLTAKKLRKLSDQQRDSMMIEINKLFYDKCHKPASPPKRKMEDKATSTLPAIQCDVKQIFRVNGTPTILNANNMPAVATPITFADFSKPLDTSTYMPKPVPKTEVPPSNVPEPVVQEAATPKPPNNENSGFRCGLM